MLILCNPNEFSEIYEKLNETGTEIQEELLSITLILSLLNECGSFPIATETRDTLPTLSSLKQMFLEAGKKVEEEELNQ